MTASTVLTLKLPKLSRLVLLRNGQNTCNSFIVTENSDFFLILCVCFCCWYVRDCFVVSVKWVYSPCTIILS